MGWAAQGDTDVSDGKTSPPQFGWRNGPVIFNCFTEHASFQARKVEVCGQSRADTLAISGGMASTANRASGTETLAMPQNGLLGAETDNRHPRRLVGLLFLTVIFIPHEAMPPKLTEMS
jgi:hypothetical protein